MKTIHLNSSFKKAQSLATYSVGFNLHAYLAMAKVHKCHILCEATYHGSSSPQHLSQYYKFKLANCEYLLVEIETFTFGKQPLEQVHLSGKGLPTLDFPMPGTMLWISHSESLLGRLATAETCQLLTSSSNKVSISDPLKVKTIHRRPGKNFKYNLNLHYFYKIIVLHVDL